MWGVSTMELLIVLVIVLLIFGAGKLPQIGKQLGSAITEFKNSVRPKEETEKPTDTPDKTA